MSKTKTNPNEKMVKRFTKPTIIAHWMNALAFFMLYLSALPMYTETFDWVYKVFGGPENARLAHRIFGVMFIIPTFYMLIADPKSFWHWIKQCFTWKKHDFQFFLGFPKEFFVGKGKVPKQDFYNAGEKINSLLQIFAAIFIIASGLIMWFASHFPYVVVTWAYPIHNIAVGLATAVFMGHLFLSAFHPNSKVSMRGITKGDVPLSYAKEHHGRWYDELMEEEASKNDDDKKGA